MILDFDKERNILGVFFFSVNAFCGALPHDPASPCKGLISKRKGFIQKR
jgi:hypothetical protein